MIINVMVTSNASSNFSILLIPHFQRRMIKPSVLIAPVTRAFSNIVRYCLSCVIVEKEEGSFFFREGFSP